MAADVAVFDDMKSFLAFGEDDVTNLRALRPILAAHGQRITDAFYERLSHPEETARMIEGRVDALKRTHMRWMLELCDGEYGQAYFDNRLRVGQVHVKIGLDTWWVEGVMSFIRSAALDLIREQVADTARAAAIYQSLVKILDLDLLVINVAYAEERLDRLTNFTGMSRKLIERCIRKG